MRLHPWNRDFTWTPHVGPHAAAFDSDGYVLVRSVLTASDLDPVTAALDASEARTTEWLRKQPGGTHTIAQADAITFTVHLAARLPEARVFASHPVFAELCASLVGPEVRLYWDQAVYKKPEPEREFPWHQDNGYTYVEPQEYLTCWVPLTEATVDNGCPWVVPGIHRLGTLAHWTTPLGYQCLDAAADAVPIEASPGDVVVFSSLTPHRTGPNRTDSVRKAYILQYAPVGAVTLQGSPSDGPPTGTTLQDDPDRQFMVVGDL